MNVEVDEVLMQQIRVATGIANNEVLAQYALETLLAQVNQTAQAGCAFAMGKVMKEPSILEGYYTRPSVILSIDNVLHLEASPDANDIFHAFKSRLDYDDKLWKKLFSRDIRENMKRLNNEFGPRFVISSTWADALSGVQMSKMFELTGMDFISHAMHPEWMTSKRAGFNRIDEIQKWMKRYYQAEPYIVIDGGHSDLQKSYLAHCDNLVLCEPGEGFTDAKLAEAQASLRRQLKSQGIPPWGAAK